MCLATGLAPKCHFVSGLPFGNPGIPKVGTPATLGAHNFVCRPPIEMKSKSKLYPSLRAFQRYITRHLHARKSRRFLAFSGLYFGHNFCFKCPNGSCKPILRIYVPGYFQWYKELLNPMGFDPWNCSLKIQESIGIPIPKMGVHLGVWGFIPSHSPTLLGTWDVTPRLPYWPAPLQALALVARPRLGLRQLPFWK
jgi:hypothetical protein